jgi:hypothetical protein
MTKNVFSDGVLQLQISENITGRFEVYKNVLHRGIAPRTGPVHIL